MYIQCNLEFILERPKAIARPWWILQKLFFAIFKRFISKQSFSLKINFSESTHGLRTASKNRSKTYAAPCRTLVCLFWSRACTVSTHLLAKWTTRYMCGRNLRGRRGTDGPAHTYIVWSVRLAGECRLLAKIGRTNLVAGEMIMQAKGDWHSSSGVCGSSIILP